jgi:hypothetical protein
MNKVVEFKEYKRWWYTEISLSKLNSKLAQLESEGWQIKSANPVFNLLGVVKSYSLHIYRDGNA